MKDSILKGAGNSRFLKSAVPAGTSWADALAMLQAGTFPIDFNGINAEGFQQVGTPLNKANLLKDATAAQIGLPPSTTPDGMFQALGNTGELHVWRKTVTTTQEVPGGYTLGEALNDVFLVKNENSSSYVIAYVYLATSISANDDGVISADWGNQRTLSYNGEFVVNGPMYMKIDNVHANSTSDFDAGDIVFIPNGYSTRKKRGSSGYSIYFDRCQKVNPYPKTPAGTTTTYPVSTNPNAYQEGSDAKPAGYTLGEPKTTVIPIHPGNTIDPFYYGDANNVAVTNDGVVSVSSGTYVSLSPYNTNNTDSVKGKYIQGYPTGYPVTSVYYIPADATFSNANGELVCDKAQLVTGYAAIPAGTTIEYLGKLGDKARVQVVSYVGMGTNSSETPNSLSFDFVPKIVFILCWINTNSNFCQGMLSPLLDHGFCMVSGYSGYGDSAYLTVKSSGNKITWTGKDPYYQLNESGAKYYAVAIG